MQGTVHSAPMGKFGAFVEGLTRYSVIVTAECPMRVIKGSKGCNLIRVATVNCTERELYLIFSGMTPIQARASFDRAQLGCEQ